MASDVDRPIGEDVEGVDPVGGSGWGDYPLDAVFVRTETRTVGEVVKRIDALRYVLDPDFQRDFVWPAAKQSKLIESCIMRIPLPVFYVAEASDGRIIVVDGLQRLTTFARFVGNALRLIGLDSDDGAGGSLALERKYFRDLPLNLQERVLDTQLTMYILDAKAPERARLDIFERVNSGEPLTRQQMRNALYNGPATIWLKAAAEGDAFRSATGQSLRAKTMRDREAINRFVAFFLLGPKAYTAGDMDGFLAAGLVRLGGLLESDRVSLRRSFDDSMKLNRSLFGEHAFRKSLGAYPANVARSVINVSIFEVLAVIFARLQTPELDSRDKNALRGAVIELLKSPEFERAVTYSTNSTVAVQKRFSLAEKAFMEAVIL